MLFDLSINLIGSTLTSTPSLLMIIHPITFISPTVLFPNFQRLFVNVFVRENRQLTKKKTSRGLITGHHWSVYSVNFFFKIHMLTLRTVAAGTCRHTYRSRCFARADLLEWKVASLYRQKRVTMTTWAARSLCITRSCQPAPANKRALYCWSMHTRCEVTCC